MVNPRKESDSPPCGETFKKLPNSRPQKSRDNIHKSDSLQDTVNDFSSGPKIRPENSSPDATGPEDQT